eukprot:1161325-Pelagomonas_calceolata.AAC.31
MPMPHLAALKASAHPSVSDPCGGIPTSAILVAATQSLKASAHPSVSNPCGGIPTAAILVAATQCQQCQCLTWQP